MTIANLSQYLVDELSSRDRKYPLSFDLKSYEKEVLDHLVFKIKDRYNLEKKIYSKYLLTQIRRNLKLNKITKKHLELLSANQINNAFIKRYNNLINFLILNNQGTIIPFITNYLLRNLLNEYSPKYLKELPKKIFSDSYFQHYEKVIDMLVNDSKIISNSKQIFCDLLTELEIRSNELEFDYQKIFSMSIRWNENIDYLIQYLRNKFEDKSLLLNNLLTTKNFNELKNNVIPIITDFIKILIEKISYFIILESLDKLEKTIGHGYSLPNYNFETTISLLTKQIPIKNFSSSSPYISRAYFWSFTDLVNKNITNKIILFSQEEVNIFTNELIIFLKKNINKTKISYFNNNFDSLMYSFKFKSLITIYTEEFLKRNIRLIKKELLKNRTLKGINNEEYVIHVSKKIFKYLRSEGFRLIPSYLNENIIKMLFDSFFKTFCKNDQKWKVFYILNDIDCNKKIFSIGDTLFYDSRVWNFGESFKFDLPVPLLNLGKLKGKFITYRKYSDTKGTIKFQHNSARAVTNINAKDPFMAIEKGKIILSKVIDSLVFASSARKTYGSRPRIYGHYMTLDSNNNKLLHGESIPFIETLELNEKYNLIIKSFDKFFNSNTNRFKDKLERSLSWYNIGKWNTFSHERFTGFWVALEQLISTNTKTKKQCLVSIVPRLTINWKNSSLSFTIIQHINEIVRLVNKDPTLKKMLDQDIKLKYYKYDTANTILSNLTRLKKKTKGNNVEHSITNLQLYLKSFDSKKMIFDIDILQKNQQFTIASLNTLRNKILHEGLSYSPQIEYLLIELENMLTSLIYNILIFGYKKEIDKIIYEFNKPYQFSLSRLNGYNPTLQYHIA